MIMKSDHRVDKDGKHYVLIDGLRVWVHQSGAQWIAQGLDIDYATSGESRELAAQSFLLGLCLTITEHLKRFNSLEKLVSKPAPDEIFKAWIRAVETHQVEQRVVDLPADELPNIPADAPRPIVKFFESSLHS